MGGRSRLAFIAAVLVAGCGESGTNPRCITGSTNACLCVGGGSGVQVCGADGAYGACVCAAPGTDAGADSASPGDSTAPGDAIAPPDGSSPSDATPQPDASPPVDATAPGDGPVPSDSAPPPDTAAPLDGSPPADVTAPPPDAPPPPPDATPPMDAPVTPPDVARPPDAAPPDAGSCAALPMTASAPTRLMLARPSGAEPDVAVAFTPSGRLAMVGADSTFNSGSLSIHTADGFAMPFATTTVRYGALAEARFLADDRAAVRARDLVALRVVNTMTTVYQTPSGMGVAAFALDRAGGIYYLTDDRLFRTTVGTLGPGDYLTRGLRGVDGMVLNADGSALFYASTGPTPGIYRIALGRDASGVPTATAPALYFPADAIGTPLGLAIDVCGNVYTADERARLIWRIAPGATPGTASTRPVAVVSGVVSRPVFGAGGFDATRLYWLVPSGIFGTSAGLYYASVGATGVRQ